MEAHSLESLVGTDKKNLTATNTEKLPPSISFVLPAYNEQEVIEQAVQEADSALSVLTNDYEILVVDDGSTDNTAQILTRLSERFGHLRVLTQPGNIGYGAALRRGFKSATKDLVGFTDADCQFELSELERLVYLASDYDIVCGYRIDRQDPFLRCFYSNVYNTMVRTLLGTRVRDCDCALKLFHRETLSLLPITTDGFLVNGEMLSQAREEGLSIIEVGVTHRPRAAGTSKVSIMHIPVVLAALIRYWWNSVLLPKQAMPQDLPSWSSALRWKMGLLLMALSSLVLLTNLNYALFDPDETRYAQISLEMVESGDWIVPRLGGEPYLDKPPALYWLTACSYKIFGANEMSARLPVAFAGCLTILALFVLGRRLIGDQGAWIGAFLLMLSSGFVVSGRFIMMDGLLTLFTTVGLLSAAIALHQKSEKGWGWWMLAGIACGLGILTKGPVAAVICFPPVILAAWLTKNRNLLRWQAILAIGLPMLFIAGPWYYLISTTQQDFSSHFFLTHHLQRFLNAFNHSEPWWFYLPVLAVGLLPASLLFPAFAIYFFGRGKNLQGSGTQGEPLRFVRTHQLGVLFLAGLWVISFFSLSSCKLPAYILPAFPPLCLALGKMLYDVQWSTMVIPTIRRTANLALVRGMVLVSCAALVAILADQLFRPEGVSVLALGFLLVPAAAWMIGHYGNQKYARNTWVATAMLFFFVLVYGYTHVIPQVANWRSLSRTAANLQQQLGRQVPVVYFGRKPNSAIFSIPQDAVKVFEDSQIDQFRQFMNQHPVAVVVTSKATVTQIRNQCDQTVQLRKPPSDIRGPAARGKVFVAESIAADEVRIGQQSEQILK